MTDFRLQTPVALILFNRPDTTARVFAEIARAKPPRLLVIGDGARTGKAGEAEQVAAARAVVNRVDWDCEVLTNYSDDNLGCRRRVSSGIDWLFAQEETAIILEDDCLPHPSFFRFCEELLAHYRLDPRISQINGGNFQGSYRLNSDSYYYSRYSHVWGWASWRDRWQGTYDVSIAQWPGIRDAGQIANLVGGGTAQERYWRRIFDAVFDGSIDTWDYQWMFACMLQGRLTVLPNVNLVSNIGFGPGATHTTGTGPLSALPLQPMSFPLRHPETIVASRALDQRFFERFWQPRLDRRVMARLRRMLMGEARG